MLFLGNLIPENPDKNGIAYDGFQEPEDKTQESGMYPDTQSWNPFVGCKFDCTYCVPSYKWQLKRVGGNPHVRHGKLNSDAEMGEKVGCTFCSSYTPHYHPERLTTSKIPNKPIVFVFGNGDISFCDPAYMRKTFDIIKSKSSKKTIEYYFQSKNPRYLKQFIGEYPKNTILLTTLETNRDEGYDKISKAPKPSKRYQDFLELDFPKKALTKKYQTRAPPFFQR